MGRTGRSIATTVVALFVLASCAGTGAGSGAATDDRVDSTLVTRLRSHCTDVVSDDLGEGTLVGTIMGNFAGSRRLSAGAARDHLLGFSGVNGRGESFKSGGRVMKNVNRVGR